MPLGGSVTVRSCAPGRDVGRACTAAPADFRPGRLPCRFRSAARHRSGARALSETSAGVSRRTREHLRGRCQCGRRLFPALPGHRGAATVSRRAGRRCGRPPPPVPIEADETARPHRYPRIVAARFPDARPRLEDELRRRGRFSAGACGRLGRSGSHGAPRPPPAGRPRRGDRRRLRERLPPAPARLL